MPNPCFWSPWSSVRRSQAKCATPKNTYKLLCGRQHALRFGMANIIVKKSGQMLLFSARPTWSCRGWCEKVLAPFAFTAIACEGRLLHLQGDLLNVFLMEPSGTLAHYFLYQKVTMPWNHPLIFALAWWCVHRMFPDEILTTWLFSRWPI